MAGRQSKRLKLSPKQFAKDKKEVENERKELEKEITTAAVVLASSEEMLENEFDEDLLESELSLVMMAELLTECAKRERKEYDIKDYPPDEFQSLFCVSKETYIQLCDRISEFPIVCHEEGRSGRPSLPIEIQVQLFLWFLSHTESVKLTARRFEVAMSSVVGIVRRVTKSIVDHLYSEFLVWPKGQERELVMATFEQNYQIPGVIGVLDAIHIPIKSHLENPEDYKNFKNLRTIILQAVCREDLRFLDCYAESPGRLLNVQVLMNSSLYMEGAAVCGDNHLIGGSDYPLMSWLLTPFNENDELTEEQLHFNTTLYRAQDTVSKALMALLGRFPKLKFIEMKYVEDIPTLIQAAFVVHNMCIVNSEDPTQYIEEMGVGMKLKQILVLDSDLSGTDKRAGIAQKLYWGSQVAD